MKLEAEHFSSQIRRARHSNYTLENGLKEFCDNVIKKANRIDITTVLDDNGYLQKIIISDDYVEGFKGINNQGRHNPFNMGCINTSHEDDDETSEFGLGMKTACIALGDEMEVFTKVDNETYNVRFNFIDMAKADDVTLSYQAEYMGPCNPEQYDTFHPHETGSTIIIKDARKTIYPKTTIEELETKLIKCLGETYGRLLFSENNSDGCQLSVNNKPVAPGHDYYQDEKCKPFTTIYNICVLTKEEIIDSEIRTTEIFYRKKINDNVTYTVYDGMWKKTSEEKCMKDISRYTVMYGSTWSIEIESTFVLYSDKFLTKPQDDDLDLLPKDGVLIYKDKRLYSKNAIKRHNNGSHNYTQHSIKFKSKQIGKNLGITYNKTFSMDQENDLTNAITSTIDSGRKCFSADTSTFKYIGLYKIAESKKLISDDDWRCYKDKDKNNTMFITDKVTPNSPLSVITPEIQSERVSLDDQTSQVMIGGTSNITPPLSSIETIENKETEEKQTCEEEPLDDIIEEKFPFKELEEENVSIEISKSSTEEDSEEEALDYSSEVSSIETIENKETVSNITPPLSSIETVAPTHQVTNNNMSNTDNTNSQISLPSNHIPTNDPYQTDSRVSIINQHSDNGEHIDDCIQDINECSKKKEEELAKMKTKLLNLLDKAKSLVVIDTYQEEILEEINEVYNQLSIIYG
jgi:hypothetical protein